MTVDKIRRAYRICPCNAYDVEGIQTWLEDMAEDGLMLEKDGYFPGFMCFVRTAPCRAIYRLEPIQKEPVSIFDADDTPEEELVETSAQMGWEYLTRYGMFYIYRTADPRARELHTDPAVQALALDTVRKRLYRNILNMALWLLIWFGLRTYAFGNVYRNAAAIGLLFTISYLAFFLCKGLQPLLAALRLGRYRKRLAAGDRLTSKKNWKKTAPAAVCGKLLVILLPILCLVSAAVTLSNAREVPIAPERDVPFVSIADLIPGGQYTHMDVFDDYNTVRRWSTAIAPENYEWNEWATVTGADGTTYSGVLRIDYHETESEWLAEGLADDYYHYDRHRYGIRRFQDLDAPDAAVDSIRIYENYLIYVLIQHENIVIHATMTLQDQNDESLMGLWIEETVHRLTEGET